MISKLRSLESEDGVKSSPLVTQSKATQKSSSAQERVHMCDIEQEEEEEEEEKRKGSRG